MPIKTNEVLVGCDPEIAVFDAATSMLVPAWEITSSNKGDKPFHVSKRTSVHADGVALEFNMLPVPMDSFEMRVQEAYKEVIAFTEQVADRQGKKFVLQNQAECQAFSKGTLEHPLANIDGCDPDFCAYSVDPMVPRERKPLNAVGAKRFFGGHIHLGYDSTAIPAFAVARLLDLFVYGPMAYYDHQGGRRDMYGLAGLFRPKPYGMEYRTPSNFWLSGNFTTYLVRNLREVFIALERRAGKLNKFFNSFDWTKVTDYINNPKMGDSQLHSNFVRGVMRPEADRLDMEIMVPG